MGGLKFFFVVGTRGYWEVILVCLREEEVLYSLFVPES